MSSETLAIAMKEVKNRGSSLPSMDGMSFQPCVSFLKMAVGNSTVAEAKEGDFVLTRDYYPK